MEFLAFSLLQLSFVLLTRPLCASYLRFFFSPRPALVSIILEVAFLFLQITFVFKMPLDLSGALALSSTVPVVGVQSLCGRVLAREDEALLLCEEDQH